jgi:N-methylhydantoinase A/oxoprolinase/acetone carboxylase beta subunit
VDEAVVRKTAEEIRARGIRNIAIIGIYSPIDSSLQQEQHVSDILCSVLGEDINITLSHKVAGVGFIERENATILNATILPFARKTIGQFQRSIRELEIPAKLWVQLNSQTYLFR